MKRFYPIALLAGAIFVAASLGLTAQEGPKTTGSDPVAKPRKKGAEAEPEQQKIPSKFSKKGREDAPEGSANFKADVTTVSVDISVLDNKGNFIPKIPPGNFRILEDNVPQKLGSFATSEAPMTVCLVIEFSNRYQQYYSETWFQTLQATYGFVDTLRPDDAVAVVAYDLRSDILSDFSTDRRKTQEALQRLRIAAFSESNFYDALVDTAERMTDIEGRKAIVVIASGIDTFSKLTFDKTRKRLQEAGVPIYAFGLMQSIREMADSMGYLNGIQRLDFLQADNQMRTFAKETGGMSFFPRFYGEFPNIFRAISDSLRQQYSVTYAPSNQARDGKYRKIKVELVNPATNEPLRVVDEKGKPIKYTIIAKHGYTAPREVE
ncbi:MAG: VWA domain-containing protein [Bryobacteraceae bacterium]